jgi:DNA-3-methyladenine glycosylase
MVVRLNRKFYERPTLAVARDLLGQRLVKVEANGERITGFILETEAYIGTEDDACHAKAGLTPRNHSMWGPAGHSYVYFTYGMHWMLNLVTEKEGFPAAVLLRAVYPEHGTDLIRERRAGQPRVRWTDGPGKLCQAFGIDGEYDGLDLCSRGSTIHIERTEPVAETSVTIGPRVGLNRVVEPWKSIPWRFQISAEEYVARGGS